MSQADAVCARPANQIPLFPAYPRFKSHAPSPRSSGHRASGSCQYDDWGYDWPCRAASIGRTPRRAAAGKTYPAIVKSGDVCRRARANGSPPRSFTSKLMPPALDRLLASPSALRLLRSIVTAPDSPARCCAAAQRRTYAKHHGAGKRKWQRWSEQPAVLREREQAAIREREQAVISEQEQATMDQHENALRKRAETAPKVASRRIKPEAGFDFLNDILGDEEAALEDDYSVEDPDKEWAARLAHRDRLDGLDGILAVWQARRREGYSLPTENSANAQFLWKTFARHPRLVHDVIDHAVELQQRGATYPRVYSVIMGYWLGRQPIEALEYHDQMLEKLHLEKLPLRELAQSAQTYGNASHEALLDIYRDSNERDLYDSIVPRLVNSGNIEMAYRWHTLCSSRDDLPSETFAAIPIIQLFTAKAAPVDPKMRKREDPNINKPLMKRLIGRDSAPVRFEDAFTARMFATRTVQIDSIIKGLTLVGVNEIGPQAVLAMASRTQPITDLPRHFEGLRAAGIALQGSVFSLALEKFAMDGKWDLVESIMESDQHLDVYGDADTQRALLAYYLDQKDAMQAQRTLAILSLFHNDPGRESWNLLLQLRLASTRPQPQDIFSTLLEMRSIGATLSSASIASVRLLLARRQRGHRPQPSAHPFDDLRFVTRFYVTALEAGMTRIPPEAWHEIIRRLGMLGRLRELKRLLLWLLSWYAPLSPEFAALPRSAALAPATAAMRRLYPVNTHYYNFPTTVPQQNSKAHPIRVLFPPSLQQGLVVWGFRTLLPEAPLEQSLLRPPAAKPHHRPSLLQKNILTRLRWDVGLRILVQLRDLGVHVHPHTVAKALQAQFVSLFGYGRSRVKANRRLEQGNEIEYAEFVRGVNEAWGQRLFTEPRELARGVGREARWHPRFRRRIGGEVSVGRGTAGGRTGVEKSEKRDSAGTHGKRGSHGVDRTRLDDKSIRLRLAALEYVLSWL
ncbi:hypothetical protein C7974DRAFT_467897 [Boeremia exigua]|uniref:uncharacterized protein n=1 Tax=Boeremia exigua TaxID=749465 RepID=UPI001E8E86AB|nr:uncharacterized protein C7974DRAFT_467897 [Boeremia exigua]KAH6644231.1 hypothetical protein C7974DRAFT_467897 [Boeremia exigua]